MKKTYDIGKKGLSEFLKDLEKLEKNFKKMNKRYVQEIITHLNHLTMFNLNSISSVDDDPLHVAEAIGGNRTKVVSGEYVVLGRLWNTTEEATYMEFGYGIVGKGQPYMYERIFDMGEAGWIGYDIDSMYSKKMDDRSWIYKGVKTWGQPSGNAFANAFVMVGDEALSIATRYVEQLLGGGK